MSASSCLRVDRVGLSILCSVLLPGGGTMQTTWDLHALALVVSLPKRIPQCVLCARFAGALRLVPRWLPISQRGRPYRWAGYGFAIVAGLISAAGCRSRGMLEWGADLGGRQCVEYVVENFEVHERCQAVLDEKAAMFSRQFVKSCTSNATICGGRRYFSEPRMRRFSGRPMTERHVGGSWRMTRTPGHHNGRPPIIQNKLAISFERSTH